MSGTQSVQPVQIAERQDYEREVSKDPRMPGPWLELIAHVRRGGSTDDIRDVYDRFFEFFPQAAVQWIEYINWELSQSNFSEVDAIFVRCLRTTLSVDLWKVYLAYTRRVNPLPPFTAEENSPRDQTRQVLEDAYEFALKYIGWDRESGPIWQEYIQLIREREVRGAKANEWINCVVYINELYPFRWITSKLFGKTTMLLKTHSISLRLRNF